jgi:type IV secretion system protein VirB3
MEIFLISQNLVTLAISVPAHGLCMLLCARDPRFFELALMAMQTRALAIFRTLRFWGAASYSPLMLDLPDSYGRRRATPWVLL